LFLLFVVFVRPISLVGFCLAIAPILSDIHTWCPIKNETTYEGEDVEQNKIVRLFLEILTHHES
jgi:hypothetical protein